MCRAERTAETCSARHAGPARGGSHSTGPGWSGERVPLGSRLQGHVAPPLSLCVFRLVLLGIQTSRAHRSDRPPRIGRRCYAVAVDEGDGQEGEERRVHPRRRRLELLQLDHVVDGDQVFKR